jgi:hypothetical protein
MMGNQLPGQPPPWMPGPQQRWQQRLKEGAWWESQQRKASEKVRIPDRPLTVDPFTECEQQAAQLRALVAAGQLSQAQLEACLKQMAFQDGQGQWWLVGAKSGQWYRYNGTKWVLDSPPRRGGRRSAAQARGSGRSAGAVASMPAAKPRWRRTLGALFNGLFATGLLLWLTLLFLGVIDEHFVELEPGMGMLIFAVALLVGLWYTVHGVRKARRGD